MSFALALFAVALPALVPAPAHLAPRACAHSVRLDRPLRFPAAVDAGGFALLRERWTALGIPAPVRTAGNADVLLRPRPGAAESYALDVADGAVRIGAADAHGGFDALATLAQLPVRDGARWTLPCVAIEDRPAQPWRIVSDDVSRGPFPTRRYAEERIRGLAALKIDGWSPYLEHVVVDPRAPYVASPDGWTADDLRALAAYARRFHVALIPEQQTFAHLHGALAWESLAPLAELPHGYLAAESDARTYAWLGPLVRTVVAATAPAPFVHLGVDEPLDLGHGRTPRTPEVIAEHIRRVEAFVAGSGARPVIWDDAIQRDPSILRMIPRETVIATFHYGVEPSYRRYLDTVADAGFDQFVAPGAANWNEIYPDLTTAYADTARFVAESRATRGVLGTFFTVWHDDGESLYEATWPAVAFAAATAWEDRPVDLAAWHARFARAFFGSDDPRLASGLDALRAVRDGLRTTPADPIDYVFWHDPFDPALQARARTLDLAAVRTRAEGVLADLWTLAPPLHPEAAAVMRLAALRYDRLARRLQIGAEARAYYDDGRAQAVRPGVDGVYRSLGVAQYLCWELRDELTDLWPRYAAAWRYESTETGLARVEVRYRDAEADAMRRADAIARATRESYLREGRVPSWDEATAR